VVMLAQEEARRLGHNFVGTEQVHPSHRATHPNHTHVILPAPRVIQPATSRVAHLLSLERGLCWRRGVQGQRVVCLQSGSGRE